METTGMWRPCEDNMEKHGDNMRTMWRQHWDNMGTTGMWRPHGDNMGTTGMYRPSGDNMETTWGQHEDNVETTWGQIM